MSSNYAFGSSFYFYCINYDLLFVTESNSLLLESKIGKLYNALHIDSSNSISRNQFKFVVSIGYEFGRHQRFRHVFFGSMISKMHALTFIPPLRFKT